MHFILHFRLDSSPSQHTTGETSSPAVVPNLFWALLHLLEPFLAVPGPAPGVSFGCYLRQAGSAPNALDYADLNRIGGITKIL
jgi:hypothetical protein